MALREITALSVIAAFCLSVSTCTVAPASPLFGPTSGVPREGHGDQPFTSVAFACPHPVSTSASRDLSSNGVRRNALHRPFTSKLRQGGVRMSEIPWEPSARPDNNVGYSSNHEVVPTRSLATEARDFTKFLGDLPMQRVFVTAKIETPECWQSDEVSRKPSYRMPGDATVNNPEDSFKLRSNLHRMMYQEVIDAYTGNPGGKTAVEGGAKLHLRIGNANGCFRRWPKEQYSVTLHQVGNNEFEITPDCPQEPLLTMGIVHLRVRYIASERVLKVSGYMDGANIDSELRALNMGNVGSRSGQRV